MPDKERERHYLTQLRRCVELPSGEPEEPEPPDFLLGLAPQRIGIEMTEYHHPPNRGERPHQETQSLKDQVVDTAEQMHAEAGGAALYVTAIFGRHGRLAKDGVQPIARALAGAILAQHVPRSMHEPDVEILRGSLPREIAHARIHGSVDGEDKLWYADAGGWVAKITSADVQRELDRKGRMASSARAKCDVLWLVIVHNHLRGAPSELTAEARVAAYRHAFDRVLWLDTHRPRAIDLARAG